MAIARRTLGASLAVWGASFDQMALIPVAAVVAEALGATPLQAALVTSGHGIGSIFGNLLGGMLVDRTGPKRAMRIAVLLAVVTALGYLAPLSVATFLLVQLVHGASTALINPAAYAILTDGPSEGSRVQRLARSGIANATSALVASPIAAMLVKRYGLGGLAPLLVAMLALTGYMGFRMLRPYLEEYRHSARADRSVGGVLPWVQLVPAYLAAFGLILGQGTLGFILPRMGRDMGLPAAMTGAFFSAFAATALICFVVGRIARLSDRVGRLPVMSGGLLLVLGGLLTMSVSSGAGQIYLGMATYGFGFGLLFPAMGALVADVTPPARIGQAYGIFYSLFGLGGVAGPLLAGWLTELNALHLAAGPVVLALVVTSLTWLVAGRPSRTISA